MSIQQHTRIRDKQVDEDGKSETFNYDEDAAILEEAKRFLRDYPSLLPKLTSDGEEVASWPSAALKFLGENYEPVARTEPFLAMVPR